MNHTTQSGYRAADYAALVLRLGLGLLMLMHGLGKLSDLVSGKAARFPDVLGIGSEVSLVLVTFAEFFCALAVVLGFRTRWAALPIIATMLVAVFVYHAADGMDQRELPLLYAVGFLGVSVLGSGRLSLDERIRARGERREVGASRAVAGD